MASEFRPTPAVKCMRLRLLSRQSHGLFFLPDESAAADGWHGTSERKSKLLYIAARSPPTWVLQASNHVEQHHSIQRMYIVHRCTLLSVC